jgi:T-complex protein 1 subunit gamma
MTECKDAKACSIILRGASKDVLNEIERNLHDALGVARNVIINPRLAPGGGAIEMELSCRLMNKSKDMPSIQQWPYKALASALEVIPRTLANNTGGEVVRVMTELRAKHMAGGNESWGIDGKTGKVADMTVVDVWDPCMVKLQTYKTAIESACMILRIDDIVSGIKLEKREKSSRQDEEDETFGDERDG